MSDIDWSKQHNGIHQAPYSVIKELMPDVLPIVDTLPDDVSMFTFDIKVHMLMPRQYPCIPHWHVDNVPRFNGIQKFEFTRPDLPMYLWLSGGPLTQFKHGYVLPRTWVRFTQLDEHRGTMSDDFGWRGFIRATHMGILPPKNGDFLRRHSQVYLDAETYQW